MIGTFLTPPLIFKTGVIGTNDVQQPIVHCEAVPPY